jgi:bifunctional DNA-binding transcriptional regulator/antitoxin component of YhaV-PrlF toxin-antitoxin module
VLDWVNMRNGVSTVNYKWQVTIPEGVRKEITLKVGQRIAWEVEGGKLVGRRVRSVRELAGCFKPDGASGRGRDSIGDFASAAIARHDRVSRQKP